MEHAPESRIGETVLVKTYADKCPLIGQLLEVNTRGIVAEPVIPDDGKDYPKSEAVEVLCFVPMNKVMTIMKYK